MSSTPSSTARVAIEKIDTFGTDLRERPCLRVRCLELGPSYAELIEDLSRKRCAAWQVSTRVTEASDHGNLGRQLLSGQRAGGCLDPRIGVGNSLRGNGGLADGCADVAQRVAPRPRRHHVDLGDLGDLLQQLRSTDFVEGLGIDEQQIGIEGCELLSTTPCGVVDKPPSGRCLGTSARRTMAP